MIPPTFTHISKNICSKVRASLCYLQNSFREDHLLKSNGIQTRWAAADKSFQSCLTLCNPIDGSPPGSPIPGILQARTLEWVAIAFSRAWKWKVKVKSLSRVRLLATPWTAAYQAPLSMGFSSQEYWSMSSQFLLSNCTPQGTFFSIGDFSLLQRQTVWGLLLAYSG